MPPTDRRPSTAVILAAGRGQRLRPLTRHLPKPMLPLLGEPLIGYQLRLLRRFGIERAVVVTGYLRGHLRPVIDRARAADFEILEVVQPTPCGIGDALLHAEPHVRGAPVVLLGDVYVDPDDLRAFLGACSAPGYQGWLSARFGAPAEALQSNFAIRLRPSGAVAAVHEKPPATQPGIRGCGLYRLPPSIFEAIRRTPASDLRQEVELTDAIGRLVHEGATLGVHPLQGLDVNLSEPQDLLRLNLALLGDRPRWIAPDATVDAEAHLERSVVLGGAEVGRGATLVDTLVLSGARVGPNTELRHAIVTAEEVVRLTPARDRSPR